ncbi:MAG: hypothetical protein BYD32DRAFT_462396 [Podila humilis]|nr:MAG: hypothetical protein BYD32DRAFT_462396 [Podila humilis]
MEDIFDTKDSVTTSECLGLMTLSAFKFLVQAALQYRASDETLNAHVSSSLDHVPNITVFMELKTAMSQVALKSCSFAQDFLTSILTYSRQHAFKNRPLTKSVSKCFFREADGNLELGAQAHPRRHCEDPGQGQGQESAPLGT